MKAADIEVLKKLSQEAVDSIPNDLTMDGKGRIFSEGEELPLSSLLRLTEETRECVVALNDVIQKLEGRKVASKS